MSEEHLIGFAAREMWREMKDFWPIEKKEIFLLKYDIVKPLSTDVAIWPSVFQLVPNLKPPPHIEWRQGLWADLYNLTDYLISAIDNHDSYWTIAITHYFDFGDPYTGYDRDSIRPSDKNEDWKFLGYDVSEITFLSGLTNFGTSPQEKKLEMVEFGEHLNQYHLFTDYKVAMQYKNSVDKKDPGHGPFYVYGLYLIS
ncbi:MAG: hypothetical protein H7Y09_04880 [Chitinophagaceae bacterium]|nr:hypothetical protein [Anaerolineae bacterium]